MPDSRLPESDDERVDALQQVLRSNGVGGAAPFTVTGEIEQMGHVGRGVARSGWRRGVALLMVGLIIVPIVVFAVARTLDLLRVVL